MRRSFKWKSLLEKSIENVSECCCTDTDIFNFICKFLGFLFSAHMMVSFLMYLLRNIGIKW